MSEILLITASEYHSLKKEVMSIKGLVADLVEQLRQANALKAEVYLSTEEVEEKYKISHATLHRRKNAGEINAMQSGRTLRWAESDIQRLFTKRKLTHVHNGK